MLEQFRANAAEVDDGADKGWICLEEWYPVYSLTLFTERTIDLAGGPVHKIPAEIVARWGKLMADLAELQEDLEGLYDQYGL